MERGDESGSVFGPSSIQSSPTSSQVRDEEDLNDHRQDDERHNQEHQQPGVTYRLNALGSNVVLTSVREDVWSCLVLLSTFWFFASITVIFAFCGSENIQLGPNSSLLIQANRFFFQSIKAQEISESKHGPMLYGFNEPPPLDVKITWSETHNALIESSHHKEWQYFLNKRSKVKISYSVESPSSAPFSLIIAKGRKSLLEWIEDPSYPDTTLSWNIVHGNGTIEQEIFFSDTYYIALGNLNAEEVEVQLNFTIKAFVYNTSHAHYKCSLSHHLCSMKLFRSRADAAVLSSPGPEQGMTNSDWYVKLSYGLRWITYFVASGVMSVGIMLVFKIFHTFWTTRRDGPRFQAGNMESQRAPLLSPKDDDLSSWGSSYDSILHDEELNEWLGVASPDRKQLKEGESAKNTQRICVICFDALRDCFFLPCGHCATCFTCGTRVMEEAGTCPICQRMMKKVRKIFTV